MEPPQPAAAPEPAAATAGEITRLLAALQDGDRRAFDRLVPIVYDELRRSARRQRALGGSDTVSTTALVHETYLKLAGSGGELGRSRQHFFNVAARAMRQVLVDYARRRAAVKRGGGLGALALDEARVGVYRQAEEIIAVHQALERLEELEPRLARVVELRFFAGLSVEEVADLLGVTDRTVKRDWRRARAFLYQQVTAGPGPEPQDSGPGSGVEGGVV